MVRKACKERQSLALNVVAQHFGHLSHRLCEIVASKGPVSLDDIVAFSVDPTIGRNASMVCRSSKFIIGEGAAQVAALTRKEVGTCLYILQEHGIIFSYQYEAPHDPGNRSLGEISLFEFDCDCTLLWLHFAEYVTIVETKVSRQTGNEETGALAGRILSMVGSAGISFGALVQEDMFVNEPQESVVSAWTSLIDLGIIVEGHSDYTDAGATGSRNTRKRKATGSPSSTVRRKKTAGGTVGVAIDASIRRVLHIGRIHMFFRHNACLEYIEHSQMGLGADYESVPLVVEVYKAFLNLAADKQLHACDDNGHFTPWGKVTVSLDAVVEQLKISQHAKQGFQWSKTVILNLVDRLCAMRPAALTQFDSKSFAVNIDATFKKLTEELMESVITHRYGTESARIIRLLIEKGHLEQSSISEMGMVPMHETRQRLYHMLQDSVVLLDEVSRPQGKTPSTTFFFWASSRELLSSAVERLTLQSIFNMKLRKQQLEFAEDGILSLAEERGERYQLLWECDNLELDMLVRKDCGAPGRFGTEVGKILSVNDVETKTKTVGIGWFEPNMDKFIVSQENVPLNESNVYARVLKTPASKLSDADSLHFFRVRMVLNRLEIGIEKIQKTLLYLLEYNNLGKTRHPFVYRRNFETELSLIAEPASTRRGSNKSVAK